MAKVFSITALTLFLAFALSCGARTKVGSQAVERSMRDDLGNVVELPAEVDRAVSLAPNITEIVFALGQGKKLVGDTTFCNYPAAAEKVAKVGDTLKPNIETIVALRPQVVFVTTASQLESFTGILKEQGIEVFVTNPGSLDEVYSSIQKIGEVLGASGKAEQLVKGMKTREEAVLSKVTKLVPEERPTVFVQIDPSLYTVGKSSYITDLVAMAGGRSVTADLTTAYPKVSRETALAYDPDAIIISVSPDNKVPNDVFEGSKAVRDERIIRIDADILSRPGPRIVEALEQIYDGLHGREKK